MSYQVIIKRAAEKELDSLSAQVSERIIKHLLSLEENPRPQGIKKLQGEDGFRLRVGDYRVLYTIDDRSNVSRTRSRSFSLALEQGEFLALMNRKDAFLCRARLLNREEGFRMTLVNNAHNSR